MIKNLSPPGIASLSKGSSEDIGRQGITAKRNFKILDGCEILRTMEIRKRYSAPYNCVGFSTQFVCLIRGHAASISVPLDLTPSLYL
jgi:hypothetical protein